MNCCDEYGNCNQGRDCPCREDVYKDDMDSFVAGAVAFCLVFFCFFAAILIIATV